MILRSEKLTADCACTARCAVGLGEHGFVFDQRPQLKSYATSSKVGGTFEIFTETVVSNSGINCVSTGR